MILLSMILSSSSVLPRAKPSARSQVSGLPPSLPLMSPSGLPAAGYPASARWHVFRFQVSYTPAIRHCLFRDRSTIYA
jgi:hypothetical protein